MRDITNSVLARKAAPQIQRSFINAKKFTASLAIALGIAGISFASLAGADGTVNWTGQGTSNGQIDTVQCDQNNTAYLLWIFTLGGTNTVTSATLTVNGTPYSGTQFGNEYHFTTAYYAPNTIISASVAYTGSLGTGNSNLTISHGCPGGTTTTATTLHDANHNTVAVGSSVPLGSVMHDLATVTPSGTTAPTGNVNFTFFTNGTCTGEGTAAGTIALNGANPGIAHPSTSTSVLAPGNYAFRATYVGDANYTGSTSSCENFTVTQAQLGINTTVHSDSPDQALVGNLALGAGAHDSATVTGGVTGFALPNVTFYFFGNGVTCTNGSTTGGTQLNTVTPDSNGVAHPSTSETNLAAGTYNFMAVVAGNTNYLGATSNCEPFTVNKAQLGITTDIHNANHVIVTSVTQGSVVHDTATVTGAVSSFTLPAVTFTFFNNINCNGSGTTVTNTGADQGNASAVRSADSAALSAGSYSYQATVASNTNYLGATSACEPLTVTAVLAYWCSPGFWAQAIAHNRTGVLNYLLANAGGLNLNTTFYNSIPSNLKAPLSKKAPLSNPTLAQVLASPNLYGGPAFNSVADYISFRLGWTGTQNTGENCPVDAHGNFTGTLTISTF